VARPESGRRDPHLDRRRVTILDAHRDRFEPLAAPAIASSDALALALSKERTLEIARGLDVPMPASILARTADQVAAAVQDLGLPAVIKPLAAFRIRADGTAETVKRDSCDHGRRRARHRRPRVGRDPC